MQTKIGGPFETAKRILLKDVKGFEKERLPTSTGRGRFGGVWTEGTGRRRAGLLHQLGGLEPVEEGLGILGFQIVEPGGE